MSTIGRPYNASIASRWPPVRSLRADTEQGGSVPAPVRERLRARAVGGKRVPAAGSPWLADRLAGAARRVSVVAAGPHAVYLRDAGCCVAVLDRHAVAVPIGLRTGLSALPHVRTAVLGGGRVRLGPLTLELTRIVTMTVPPLRRLAAHADAPRAWLRAGAHPRLDAAHRQLPVEALDALAAGDPQPLIGRGGGFTPVGDDVVCGWLVTRHAMGHRHDKPLPLHRTTPVSSAFLLRAVEGEVIPQLSDLLVAVASGVGGEQVLSQLDDLAQIGSTSGAGLAIGAAVALSLDEGR
jgi:hypothetical protein